MVVYCEQNYFKNRFFSKRQSRCLKTVYTVGNLHFMMTFCLIKFNHSNFCQTNILRFVKLKLLLLLNQPFFIVAPWHNPTRHSTNMALEHHPNLRRFLGVCLVFLLSTLLPTGESCSCFMEHPQTSYCTSNYGKL